MTKKRLENVIFKSPDSVSIIIDYIKIHFFAACIVAAVAVPSDRWLTDTHSNIWRLGSHPHTPSPLQGPEIPPVFTSEHVPFCFCDCVERVRREDWIRRMNPPSADYTTEPGRAMSARHLIPIYHGLSWLI